MCGFLVVSGESISKEDFEASLDKIVHRGPDDTEVEIVADGIVGFHRLAINGLSDLGNQPFTNTKTNNKLVCNGEIYNHSALEKLVEHKFKTGSDCEVILPLYEKFGLTKTAELLDAEFAFVIWDESLQSFVAARDAVGIRPLFYGYSSEGKICFASEVKALTLWCKDIKPFPPGYFYDGKDFQKFIDLTETSESIFDIQSALTGIHDTLVEGVKKRMESDAPIGFLLSGGLDSSLVCSIAQKFSDKPIRTFAIGMENDAIDLKYAKDVADFIGSDHTEVIITKADVIAAMRKVIWHLESFDITTVRASIGMYLVCKYIHEKTDIKVLMTGEVSDEIFGYKYTDFAPNPMEFQKEAQKRLRELFVYDVLRADRCISAHSLEARVPFSDRDFVQHVMNIDPRLKMNTTGKGKYILRAAFEGQGYLPEHILWREKAAFSDAVGHSMVDELKLYADSLYTEDEIKNSKIQYMHATPFTKESRMYRDIFEEFYRGHGELIPSFWMPNEEWENCKVTDPSARVLPNYGASGS